MELLYLSYLLSLWGEHYFETQELARCGQHALNNFVGGPQFQHNDLVIASLQIVSTTEELVSEHVHANGWYSHGVLGAALQNTVPPRWRLLLQPLTTDGVFKFLHTSSISVALVNIRDEHWLAIVKHASRLGLIDSRYRPVILSESEIINHLKLHPCTYSLVLNDHSD